MGSVRDELLAKAKCIKEEVYCKNEKKIEEYKRNLLKTVPKNVKKQQEYFVQNIFKTSDSCKSHNIAKQFSNFCPFQHGPTNLSIPISA